jgi:hypothetical protein
MVGQNGIAYKSENLQEVKVAAGGGSSEGHAARHMWYFFDLACFGKCVRKFGPTLRTQNLLVISTAVATVTNRWPIFLKGCTVFSGLSMTSI